MVKPITASLNTISIGIDKRLVEFPALDVIAAVGAVLVRANLRSSLPKLYPPLASWDRNLLKRLKDAIAFLLV